jgi:hypothetical protein
VRVRLGELEQRRECVETVSDPRVVHEPNSYQGLRRGSASGAMTATPRGSKL